MGKIIKNGIEYVGGGGGGNTNYKEITLSEYEALGDKVNNDGVLYFITDIDGDGEDSSKVNQAIYSVEETIIGTWIDGKPIYRKFVYTGQNVESITDVSTLNIDVLVKIGGFAHYSSNNAWFPVQYRDNDNFLALWYDTANKQLKGIGSKTAEKGYIWLEYTKAND